MSNPNRRRSLPLIVSAIVLGALATGCSGANSAEFAALRGFTAAARPMGVAASATHAVAERHVRDHALSSTRAVATLRHRSGRTL